jgi:hypothetical protein
MKDLTGWVSIVGKSVMLSVLVGAASGCASAPQTAWEGTSCEDTGTELQVQCETERTKVVNQRFERRFDVQMLRGERGHSKN